MGAGPVLGGSAGGQDYSLASMLERAPQKHTIKQGEYPTSRNEQVALRYQHCLAKESIPLLWSDFVQGDHALVIKAFLSMFLSCRGWGA